jgi:hypothetical protein
MIPKYIKCIKVEKIPQENIIWHDNKICLGSCKKILGEKRLDHLHNIMEKNNMSAIIDYHGYYTISREYVFDTCCSGLKCNNADNHLPDNLFKILKKFRTSQYNRHILRTFKRQHELNVYRSILKPLKTISLMTRKSLRVIYFMIDTCEIYLDIYLRQRDKLELIQKIFMIYTTKNLTKLSGYFM